MTCSRLEVSDADLLRRRWWAKEAPSVEIRRDRKSGSQQPDQIFFAVQPTGKGCNLGLSDRVVDGRWSDDLITNAGGEQHTHNSGVSGPALDPNAIRAGEQIDAGFLSRISADTY